MVLPRILIITSKQHTHKDAKKKPQRKMMIPFKGWKTGKCGQWEPIGESVLLFLGVINGETHLSKEKMLLLWNTPPPALHDSAMWAGWGSLWSFCSGPLLLAGKCSVEWATEQEEGNCLHTISVTEEGIIWIVLYGKKTTNALYKPRM